MGGPVVQSVSWWACNNRTKEAHMKAVGSPTEGNDNCATQSHFLPKLVLEKGKKMAHCSFRIERKVEHCEMKT